MKTQDVDAGLLGVQLGSGKIEIRIKPNRIGRFGSGPNIFGSIFGLEA